MEKLSREEIQYIDNYLIKSKVKYWDVRMELLDHIASAVEEKIEKKEVSFNEALLEVHQSFGNSTEVYGIYHGKLLKEGLYADNNGFKKFERQKQKSIGRKLRLQHWLELKQLLITPKFLLEFAAFGIISYNGFYLYPKASSVIILLLFMTPLFYSALHSIKDKVSKRSLNITMSSGIFILAWSLYNMVFQLFVMINKDEQNKPYYILFLTAMLLYPIMRSSLNTYLNCYKNYKELFYKLTNLDVKN